jgi:hypothetical protein
MFQWIQTCSSSHKECQGVSKPQNLPTRVVEIQDAERVRLKITTEDEVAMYTTLSHAWGNGNTVQTTKLTLPCYQDQIPWDHMPKTFQEAIQITFSLGLKYIWIDSLCIIQDDDADWRKEGSRMAFIYSQSYLTIAATKSSSSAGGCFSVSSPRYLGSRYDVKDSYGDGYTIHAHPQLKHDQDTEFPLLRRGWVFQERLLSPRILHFGPEEMLWECMSYWTCECNFWVDYSIVRKSKEWWRKKGDSPAVRWQKIVEEYSSKLLTFEADIFPALQGVSKHLQGQRNCAYYAGLWEDTILKDLLWFRWFPAIRTQAWRAPSWSWAAGKGGAVWTDMKGKFTPYFSVLEISTESIGTDPLGGLKSGSLRLRGNCTTTIIQTGEDGYGLSFIPPPEKSRKGERESPRLHLYMDYRASWILLAGVSLLLMKAARSQPSFSKHGQYDFMIFRHLVSTDTYERVGLATLDRRTSWKKKRQFMYEFDRAAEETTFTVI